MSDVTDMRYEQPRQTMSGGAVLPHGVYITGFGIACWRNARQSRLTWRQQAAGTSHVDVQLYTFDAVQLSRPRPTLTFNVNVKRVTWFSSHVPLPAPDASRRGVSS